MVEEKETPKKILRRNSTKEESSVVEKETSNEELQKRVQVLEATLQSFQELFISRSEWVELNARLDIVEQDANQTMGKVRSKLDSFSKEVKHIAVVPEKELNEMFELVKLVRRYLSPENKGN